jgi:hypothetical protein
MRRRCAADIGNVPRQLLLPAEFHKLGPDSVAVGFESSFGKFVGHCPYRFGERLDRSPRRSLD